MAEMSERQRETIRRAAVVADKNAEGLKRLRDVEADLPGELVEALRTAQQHAREFLRVVRPWQERAAEADS